MSDRFNANMMIGGNAANCLPELEELIDGMNPECLETDQHMECVFNDVTYNDFAALTAFCVSHGLSYNLSFDAKWEYDGVVNWWRPGMERAKECYCLQSMAGFTFSAEELLQAAETMTLREFLNLNMPTDLPAFVDGAE